VVCQSSISSGGDGIHKLISCIYESQPQSKSQCCHEVSLFLFRHEHRLPRLLARFLYLLWWGPSYHIPGERKLARAMGTCSRTAKCSELLHPIWELLLRSFRTSKGLDRDRSSRCEISLPCLLGRSFHAIYIAGYSCH